MTKPIEFVGMDDFLKALEEIRRQYPEEAEKMLTRAMTEFKRSVQEKTPVGKQQRRVAKKLINRYKISRIQRLGGSIWKEFYAAAPHYHLVERGFKHVNGKTVKGVEMVARTEKEYESKLPDSARTMYEKLLERISK